jgi:hypothetical protein
LDIKEADMGLAALNEVTVIMGSMNHPFSEEEREFVARYAFRSGSREKTEQMIEELALAENEEASRQVMEKYKSDCEEKPAWVEQVENLLIALEMYRVEQEKAVNRIADILSAYGIEVTAEEIRRMEPEEIKSKVRQETGEVR